MKQFLDTACTAYYEGTPILSDKEFDYLAELHDYKELGQSVSAYGNTIKHFNRLWSLEKFYVGDSLPFSERALVETPKLDGAAISITYVNGKLSTVATRGDGLVGEDITLNFKGWEGIPQVVEHTGILQVVGELVAPKTVENARNYAAGASRLKDRVEFLTRDIHFIAYGGYKGTVALATSYTLELDFLKSLGFIPIIDSSVSIFPTDGLVYRLDSYAAYIKEGFTSRFPKGAFALKDTSDIAVVETILREVVWRTGKSGKVTPVAIFDEVTIEDAKITRATLKNAGFVEALDISIGNTLLVTRAGGIIPEILGKA